MEAKRRATVAKRCGARAAATGRLTPAACLQPRVMSRLSFSPFLLSVLLLGPGVFVSGCASTYQVTVEADARPTADAAPRVSFRIDDKSVAASTGPLRRGEIANHLRAALSAQGLYEAPDAARADMVVEISYGIGPARVQQTVYQEIVNGRPAAAGEGLGPPPEGVARELMGYTALASTTVTREKHLSICARENRSAEAERPSEDLWRVHVSIESDSEDLRGHLPVLAAVAMDHLGRNTEGPTTTTRRDDDGAIRFIRQGF